MSLPSVPPASAALFGLAFFVLIGSNISLALSGWMNELSKKPPPTGVFILDLLIEFFQQVIREPSASMAWLLIGGVAAYGSNLVIFEGSRRRGPKGGFNQTLLAAYWWIAQFVAIGFATPLFLGLYLMKPMKNEEFVHVGNFRTGVALVALVGTGAMVVEMESTIYGGRPVSVPLMVAFLLFPVVLGSASVLIDRSKTPSSSGKYLLYINYAQCFFVSIMAHYRSFMLVARGDFSMAEFLANPPAVFLAFDLFGVMASQYIFFAAEGKVSALEQWPMIFLLGPGFHLTYLGLLRDRKIDAAIEESQSVDKKD